MKKFSFIMSMLLAGHTMYAATYFSPQNADFASVIEYILELFNQLIPVLIGAAVVAFLFGVLKYVYKASQGDEDGRKEGINFMIGGIIGIAVMLSVWALVYFVLNTFGVSSRGLPLLPTGIYRNGVDSPSDVNSPFGTPNNT